MKMSKGQSFVGIQTSRAGRSFVKNYFPRQNLNSWSMAYPDGGWMNVLVEPTVTRDEVAQRIKSARITMREFK